MARVDLPSGGWAEVRDSATTIRVRDRKAILRASDTGDSAWEQGMNCMNAVLACLIQVWSFDLPLPSTDPGSIEELEVGDYDALTAAVSGIKNELFPDAGDPSDPKAGSAS